MTSRHTLLQDGFAMHEAQHPEPGSEHQTESSAEWTAETITASDSVPLFCRHWTSESPAGHLIGLHGIQSHSGWYEWSCGVIASAGWDVRMLDRRGSGKSEGLRGHADHPDRLINDVRQVLHLVNRERGDADVPIVLLGLSWGGKLAAAVASRSSELIDGLVLLYPGIKTHIRAKMHQRAALAGALAAGLRTKTAPIPLEDPALFTADPKWQQYIKDDPRALREATLAFYGTSRDLDSQMDNVADRLTGSILLMLAGQDRIVNNQRMREWFLRIPSESTTLVEYPTAAHTLEFDAVRERWVADLLHWLTTQSRTNR